MKSILSITFFFCMTCTVYAKQEFVITQVAANLDIPWGMAFISMDELLVTEKSGKVKLIQIADGSVQTIATVENVWDKGQGGLLDVAVSPNFQNDGWLYFTYSKKVEGGAATTLAKAQFKDSRLTGWQDIFTSNYVSNNKHHFGSRITFDQQGHIFFSHGDRGSRHNAQKLSDHAGTILRLNTDGSVPKDNPFVNDKEARGEIWSYGHRNPQGITFDADNNRLWAIEHGPRGGDEVNLILPAKNYGWPVISYGKEYVSRKQVGEGTEKFGLEQPEKVYIPSIAPSSLILYSGKAFKSWQGNLFVGALKLTHINRLEVDSNGKIIAEHRLLEDQKERIRNMIEDHRGWIYVSTDSGRILRISP